MRSSLIVVFAGLVLVELGGRLHKRASGIGHDDGLLEKGLLDSASVLLVWLETQLNIELDQDELSLNNFGSITRMTEFLSNWQAR
jgi:hypothetical protein